MQSTGTMSDPVPVIWPLALAAQSRATAASSVSLMRSDDDVILVFVLGQIV